jgi:hypothetical protein
MTGHGALYGSVSGISLTVAIWAEMAGERLRTILWAPPSYIGVPRALVIAALQNKQSQSPSLQAALREEQRIWNVFSEAHVEWRIRHLVLLEEPELRAVRDYWDEQLAAEEMGLSAARRELCGLITSLFSDRCTTEILDVIEHEVTTNHARKMSVFWNSVISGDEVSVETIGQQTEFRQILARLHTVRTRQEVSAILTWIGDTNPPIMASLLEGELWRTCLDHIGKRQRRLMTLSMVTGAGDHERSMNMSLLGVTNEKERLLVRDWFGEIAGYGWVLSDVQGIVRRCLVQEAGECRRITPVEITAMEQQLVWSARLIHGMWNALPVVFLLFMVEVTILFIGVQPVSDDDAIVLHDGDVR